MKRLALYAFTILTAIALYTVILCLLPLEGIRRLFQYTKPLDRK